MKGFLLNKHLIGMVHVGPLPGTARSNHSFEHVIQQAVSEAKALENAGFGAILFENMHDAPYLKSKVGPEITAAMAVVGEEIKKATKLPLGVQILAGANEAALAVAQAVGADFIRVEGFVFSHVADEGFIDSCAGNLLRLRKEIGGESIKIFADIKKKHSSHSITSDISISETAEAAQFFGADGVIVTGSSTGRPASPEELDAVKKTIKIPVLIGSGITPQNITQFKDADGWIVGSFLKLSKDWRNAFDPHALTEIVKAATGIH
ncbi:MAG: BtpA family membrane complex biogenesis protein [Proteobacteria bacterium]|nr:BtpA family membrane complex biogenesis protein [Pseudomonadota bacterium]